jgi:hypothetical protein
LPDTADALRRLITATRPRATRHGFPSTTRARVVSYVVGRLGNGVALASIARELELPRATLRKWLDGADDNRLVPVLIAEDPPPASHDAITIISPRGFRVTVLGVDVAARLLAMLG